MELNGKYLISVLDITGMLSCELATKKIWSPVEITFEGSESGGVGGCAPVQGREKLS